MTCELFDLAALTWTGILRFSSNHVGGRAGEFKYRDASAYHEV